MTASKSSRTTVLATWTERLLSNSRFWVLMAGLVASVDIAGLAQFIVPDGSLQHIRLEQIYGYLALLMLYLALLATPLTKVLPIMPFKAAYLHARRAIGVLAFYFAFLHVWISFFQQLDGFSGLHYLSSAYALSVAAGFVALLILLAMAATSLDWAVNTMGFRNWKRLHRFVYLAGVAVLVHVAVIGPHYTHLTTLGVITYAAVGSLLALEAIRALLARRQPAPGRGRRTRKTAARTKPRTKAATRKIKRKAAA